MKRMGIAVLAVVILGAGPMGATNLQMGMPHLTWPKAAPAAQGCYAPATLTLLPCKARQGG